MENEFKWLSTTDRDILAWLDVHDVVFTPRSLYLSLERNGTVDSVPSYSQISRRVRFLAGEPALLERYSDARGYYALTDRGTRWLDDDLSEADREDLEDVERAG